MSSAKALANGYPMGALLASEEVGSHLTPGSHASTFGGNALGAAVALRSLQLIREALPNAVRVGARLTSKLEALMPGGRVVEVRGRGLLLGVAVKGIDAAAVVGLARDGGLLCNAIGDSVVRLAPALTLTDDEADEAVVKLGAAIAAAPPR
jgi:acetylornithine/N-succinyldiaminopimelate aminotransferase